MLAARVRTSTATHAVILGADFKTKVDALTNAYDAARESQMEKKGGRTEARGSRDAAKAALLEVLFKNLLNIAGFSMKPAEASLYFNQSLLEDPASPAEAEAPAP